MLAATHIDRRFRPGMTLVELMSASVMGLIIALVAGGLLVSGQRNWISAFNYANRGIQLDALETMVTFGSVGRKSNKSDYRVYRLEEGKFIRALPSPSNPEEVVTGDAVEFRYWDVELDGSLMDTAKTATSYMLFYPDDGKLKVDQGPYPPGGVDPSGNRITGGSVKTWVLAENVRTVEFSHTTKNTEGDGYGCVRLNLRLADSDDNQAITVKTATLMRNVWP